MATLFTVIRTASGAFRSGTSLRYRTFATATDIPSSPSSSSSNSSSSASASAQTDQGAVESGSESSADTDFPSNLVFQDGEVDITDEVVKMFEKDGVFGGTGNAFGSGGSSSSFTTTTSTSRLGFAETKFLPLSSLRERNPTTISSENLAIPLPPTIFAQPLRRDILHRCVVYYLSLLRQGSANTKGRGDIARSGRKLYRQKGTGKARAGDAGSGTRRGGGVIHGPHPRDFAQKLPRKVQQLGLHVALSSRLQSGLLRVVSDLGEGGWRSTRDARIALSDESSLETVAEVEENELVMEADEDNRSSTPAPSITVEEKFGPSKDLSILFVHGPESAPSSLEIINRSVRNIPGIDVLGVEDLAAYEVLRRKWTVLDLSAVEWLAERAGESELFDDLAEEMIQDESVELGEGGEGSALHDVPEPAPQAVYQTVSA